MKSMHVKLTFVLAILVLVSLGCAPSVTPPVPTAQGPIVLDPSRPLGQQVTVSAMNFQESGEAPNYIITASIPTIIGIDDPRVKAFNDLTYSIFQLFSGELKNSLLEMPATPITTGSSLDMQFSLVSPPGDIISIKYLITGYADGASQIFHNIRTVSFNIEKGQVVAIEQLFLPGTSYLQVISDNCRAELAARNISFEGFASGADPLVENYQNWNITADGLMVTFNEEQVASYSAGPQTVTVPYSALKDIIDPQGPLGKFIQ
jgi:hypothetical protein